MHSLTFKQALIEAKLAHNGWCLKIRNLGECICGADEHNAKIDVHLAKFEKIEFVKNHGFDWPILKEISNDSR